MEVGLKLLKTVFINNGYQFQAVECIIKQQRQESDRDIDEEEKVREWQ